PAQFTDVATQLAGGQSPWLILLQQGGQVKDSFGGMIPMFRGLAGAITLPMVGATSLAVIVLLLTLNLATVKMFGEMEF
ncbi:phage tail length tape measure family protein, partial [Escherichia coli]|uniref:phage tail length tape measure family protein n=1 Tax=Escherichia coli TaxID=562 RepID=UPI001EDB0927